MLFNTSSNRRASAPRRCGTTSHARRRPEVRCQRRSPGGAMLSRGDVSDVPHAATFARSGPASPGSSRASCGAARRPKTRHSDWFSESSQATTNLLSTQAQSGKCRHANRIIHAELARCCHFWRLTLCAKRTRRIVDALVAKHLHSRVGADKVPGVRPFSLPGTVSVLPVDLLLRSLSF